MLGSGSVLEGFFLALQSQDPGGSQPRGWRFWVLEVPHHPATLSLVGFLCFGDSSVSGGRLLFPFLLVVFYCSSRSHSRPFPEQPWLREAEAENAHWPLAPSATSWGAVLAGAPAMLVGGCRPGRLWKWLELSTQGPEAYEPWGLAAHLTPELRPKPWGSCPRLVFASE